MLPRAALCALFSAILTLAQTNGSVDDRLQQLYGEAKAAEAAGDLDTATTKYRSMLAIAPGEGALYNNLGALYVKQGRFKEGADVLERGLRVDRNMPSASALLGLCLFQLGEYQKARTRFEALLAAHPEDRQANFLLVQDLLKLQDFEAAAVHLQKLEKADPKNQEVLYLLGKTYMQLSEQALGKINEIDPNSVWAHQISAELMESMKNNDGAIVEWQKAQQVAPHQPGLHYKLGDLYWSLSQWDRAAEQFQQESAVDPSNCMVPWKLGNISLQRGVNPEGGLAQIDKALAECPNLTAARTDRARLLMRLHREAEAVGDLQAAAKTDPEEPSTHFLLAQAYRATGNSQQAQAEMKTFSLLEEKARTSTAERAQQVIRNSQAAH